MMASRIASLAGPLLVGLLSCGLAAEGGGQPASAAPVAPTGAVLSASGRVEPVGEERRLRFASPGRIATFAAEEGRKIKVGEMLAELENGEERAGLAAAEAELARAKAELDKVTNGARAEDRAIADAEVELARRQLELVEKASRKEERDLAAARAAMRTAETAAAARLAERVRKLRDGEAKAASQEELDSAEDRLAVERAAEAAEKAAQALVDAPVRAEDLAIARARLKLAEDRAELVKAPARAEDLAAAKAAVAAAEANRAAAEARLAKTQLKSPVDGTVLKIFQRPGETSSPAGETPVLSVGDLSKLMVRAEVDEVDAMKVRVGQTVRATARALGRTSISGRVVEVSPTMGRKRLFSEDPREKTDTKVMEALIELDGQPSVPVGYRLEVYFFDGGK